MNKYLIVWYPNGDKYRLFLVDVKKAEFAMYPLKIEEMLRYKTLQEAKEIINLLPKDISINCVAQRLGF